MRYKGRWSGIFHIFHFAWCIIFFCLGALNGDLLASKLRFGLWLMALALSVTFLVKFWLDATHDLNKYD